ncbi:ketopantoate reductase family protein [Modicisalibacter coralii]|uniref:ketopantoate reductase family protein n=1 Tax=Modicisalibacter coralii TaxID=2304602 RepID=UPI00100AB9DD|nr:2-dehydropantoate 2-reductase [Halomonas coralii]
MAAPWLILGAGSLGRLLAARLSGRQALALIGRRASVRALNLTTPEGRTTDHAVPRIVMADALYRPGLVHVTTKSHAVETALEELAGHIAADTPLVLWQNGFQVQPRVTRDWLGPVLCAVTSEGAYVDGEDGIVHAGHGTTHLGNLDGEHAALATSVARTLSAAGLPGRACDDIRRRLWHKLAVNAAINPMVAIHRIRNGGLRDPAHRPRVAAIIAEVATVMAAERIEPPQAGWSAHVWGVIEATAGNRASMLQDVLAGRPTEREAILGPLREAAARHGLETPVLETLWRDTPS